MKSQFATFEAMAALLISLSLLMLAENMVNTYNLQSLSAVQYLRASSAFYDFENQAYSNSILRSCISGMDSNKSCVYGYVREYQDLYSLGSVRISFNNSASGNANPSEMSKCIPYRNDNSSTELCFFAGG